MTEPSLHLPALRCLALSELSSWTAPQLGASTGAASFKEALEQLVAAHEREVDHLRGELSKAERDIPGVPAEASSTRSHSTPSASPQRISNSKGNTNKENCWNSCSSSRDEVAKAESSGGERISEEKKIKWNMHKEVGGTSSRSTKSVLDQSASKRLCGVACTSNRQKRIMYMVVKGSWFSVFSYILIVSSAMFIGASMQQQLNCAMSACPGVATWWEVIELAFDIAFTTELCLKFMAEDIAMFFGEDWGWNCLDLFLVASALVNRAAGSSLPNITTTRNVRLFRVTRILRVIRVVKVCQSLRVMIYAILKSLDALIWVFAVLVFFNYMFALVFVHATTEAFSSRDTSSESLLASLEVYFGGLFQALTTLFQAITNGRDWSDVYDALFQISPVYGVFFMGYIYFTVFLVLNVVVGTVVDMTTRVSVRDRGRVVREELSKIKEYTNDVQEFFSLADTDQSGTLSWDELAQYLEDDKNKAQFQALDLDLWQAHVLFDMLDEDGSGEVGIREFLEGCIRLKGQARSMDLHLAIFQLQQVVGRCTAISRAVHSNRVSSKESKGVALHAEVLS